ncbi:kinase-like protein, partial [Atractiella rhizophila]
PAAQLSPRLYPTTGFDVIPPSELVEEETLPSYVVAGYYPARLGEVLDSRFQIVGKLGYGVTSTVWMCRDLTFTTTPTYRAVKIYTRDASRRKNREVPALHHLASIQSDDVGKIGIRFMTEQFSIPVGEAEHTCLVHRPLGTSIQDLCDLSQEGNGDLPVIFLKALSMRMLHALNFLHSEARLIHTDLQPKNILCRVEDPALLEAYEEEEFQDMPTPRKIDGDRIIYRSRPLRLSLGLPVLVDYGEVRFADQGPFSEDIMPIMYRAPELLLWIPWSYKVDIWGLGMTIWTAAQKGNLFRGWERDGYHNWRHLSEMLALLGPPPKAVLERGQFSNIFFDEDGNWKGEAIGISVPAMSLEERATVLEGVNKRRFLNFIRRCLQWNPDARPTAKELLEDEWITSAKEDVKTGAESSSE